MEKVEKLFHLTKLTNKEGILKEGILVSPWSRCVYLCPTIEGCLGFVHTLSIEHLPSEHTVVVEGKEYKFPNIKIHKEFVVFEIDPSQLDMELLELSDDYNPEYFDTLAYRYFGDIPKKALVHMHYYQTDTEDEEDEEEDEGEPL